VRACVCATFRKPVKPDELIDEGLGALDVEQVDVIEVGAHEEEPHVRR